MKESFDPLAEAERRSDPQLARYNEAIGHDPSANADYATYLRTRDFEDANGNVHDTKTSKFKTRGGENDTYETDLINSAHAEALEENALRDSSLDTLAKKVAEARNSGDKEAAAHAEDLFFDKFTKLSEKYGWEEEDGSANETLHVDKDAKVGRTTIDDRLARYSKIMYGKEADTAVKSPEPVAEPEKLAVAEKVAAETDHVEKESISEPEAKSEETPIVEEKVFDVDVEVAQAKQRLHELADEREQHANEQIHGTEAAKADRELLVRVSTEGLEDEDDSKPRLNRVSTEGLEPEEGSELRRVSTEGLEEDESVQSPTKKPLGRIGGTMAGVFARLQAGRTEARHRKDSSEKEPMSRNKKIAIALGGVGLAAVSVFTAHKFGMDINPFNNAHAGGGPEAATGSTGGGSRGNGVEAATQQFSKDSLRIDRGEGLFQTFKEMGIPKNKWQEVLNQSGPKLVRMGEAYNDPSIGGFGLKGDGRLSARALGVIADTARNVK